MSIPRYTCIASADKTSVSKASATRSATALFPTAVGPVMETIGLIEVRQRTEPGDLGARIELIERGRIRFLGIHQVYKSQRHQSLIDRRLFRSDVHAAIHQHRVRGQDLRLQGERNAIRHGALPHRSGTGDGNDRPHRGSPTDWPER